MWLVSSLSPIILIYHHDWLTLLGAGVLGTKGCVLACGELGQEPLSSFWHGILGL